MGSIQRLNARSFRAYAGTQVNGKRTRKTKLFTTKRKAEAWIRDIEERLHDEATGAAPPETITVGELVNRWLASRARELRPKTIEGYEHTINRHVLPHLGHLEVRELTPYHVQAWIDEQAAAGVGATTLGHAVKRLRSALDGAVRLGLVTTNAARLATSPAQQKASYAILTKGQVEQLLAVAEADHFHPLWHLLVLAGLRRGEALGLRWRDVDLSKQEIHIKQTVEVVRSRPVIGKPKTKSAIRTIAIPQTLVNALRQHKDRQTFHITAMRTGPFAELYLDRDLVICTETGGPHNPANIYDHLTAMLERASLPRVRVHDLRHTYASHLIADGVPLPVVAKQLGHASPAITMQVYAHMVPGQQREAADAIERLFGKASV